MLLNSSIMNGNAGPIRVAATAIIIPENDISMYLSRELLPAVSEVKDSDRHCSTLLFEFERLDE